MMIFLSLLPPPHSTSPDRSLTRDISTSFATSCGRLREKTSERPLKGKDGMGGSEATGVYSLSHLLAARCFAPHPLLLTLCSSPFPPPPVAQGQAYSRLWSHDCNLDVPPSPPIFFPILYPLHNNNVCLHPNPLFIPNLGSPRDLPSNRWRRSKVEAERFRPLRCLRRRGF